MNNIFKIDKLEPDFIARLFAKISIDEITGCWNWTGNKNARGYGRMRYLGPKVLVHRIMYAWFKGPLRTDFGKDIPVVDHICNNKTCCNPEHLRLVSHKINVLRGNSNSAIEARRTHCIRGHLFPLRIPGSRSRRCQICNTIFARERYRRLHKIKGY